MATKRKSSKGGSIAKSAATVGLLALSVVQPETIPLTGLLLAAMYSGGKGGSK